MSIALAANNDLITESVYGNRFLFQGREYDYDTALYYFRARWYEPETGRWLSPDPIGISGGLNLYAFCGNDPVNFIDPTGKGGVQFGDYFLGWGDPWLVFDTPNFEVVADIASSITTGMLSGSAKGCHDIWDSADQFLSDQFNLNLPANPFKPLPPKEEGCDEDEIAEMAERFVLEFTTGISDKIDLTNDILNLIKKHLNKKKKEIN